MTGSSWMALPLLAEGTVRTTFELARIGSNRDWILPIGVTIGLMVLVRWIYRRESVTLGGLLGWLLTVLRWGAILGLLILYLHPQWRAEREVVRNSRVVVAVDTSSSMGVGDAGGEAADAVGRAQWVADLLAQGSALNTLREVHDVYFVHFDSTVAKIEVLPKRPPPSEAAADTVVVDRDWQNDLQPSGTETRIGQLVAEAVQEHRGAPLSGILLISDGGQNAGLAVDAALRLAQDQKVAISTVGVGSLQGPANVRVYKLDVAARAFPGDPYAVSGLIQLQGDAERLVGTPVEVELLRQEADVDGSTEGEAWQVVGREEVPIAEAGEVMPVRFELTPDEPGLQKLRLRIRPPLEDSRASDDFLEAEVEVVDRQDRILLFAGGPTRDYRFLRDQMHRDRSMKVDVLLQTGQPGMSQDADAILQEFPATRQEMFQYDGVVAFDPDWRQLTVEQTGLLEEWVAKQGGGMIVVAGPVHAGDAISGWVGHPAMSKIRALYPVEFHRQASVWESKTYTADEPWPLEFTREGAEAEFLWLGESAAESQQAWATFPGVYSFQPVRDAKPGATVLAYFSDPRSAEVTGRKPVYMAEQFYGSGRVFYVGGGELWRLRALDVGYFERLYTRLIRHVTQGRLLRQSSRGVLMLAQDRYVLGSNVPLRAQLTDAQLNPLALPSVPLRVARPDGSRDTLLLQADPSREGSYAGQMTVLLEGTYRLELPVPDSAGEVITRAVRVRLPELESESPERNERVLAMLAEGSGGRYFAQAESVLGRDRQETLTGLFPDRTRVSRLPAPRDRAREEEWMRLAMLSICGLLCLEWLIRRLWKLA